jgi:ribosome maturation factor RimP
VDIVVSGNNKFLVEVDSPEGISIGQCEDLNRYLNKMLDNENNEFELTVSSPGLERPFKVVEQYRKNINRELKVRTVDGKEFQALLKNVGDGGIALAQKVKEIPEGKKKKEWVEKNIELPFGDIKEAKIIITFK